MLSAILISIGTFFEEISDSIGKVKVSNGEESVFIMAFLSLFWSAIFYILICIFKSEAFIFNFASLPTFITRALLEIIQLYVSVLAIADADRSTYSFVRTMTIPLLLLIDFALGYKIVLLSVVGVVVVLIAILVLFINRKIEKKGMGLVIFSAINAVVTISLFKYNTTHFNSLVAEQLSIVLILLAFFALVSIFKNKENPFIFLSKPIFFLQSFSVGLGGVIESFGYSYGIASIATAVKRSSALLWSLLTGKIYFKEKNISLKFAIMFLLIIGLVLMSLG